LNGIKQQGVKPEALYPIVQNQQQHQQEHRERAMLLYATPNPFLWTTTHLNQQEKQFMNNKRQHATATSEIHFCRDIRRGEGRKREPEKTGGVLSQLYAAIHSTY
jgi:hypothetical protein